MKSSLNSEKKKKLLDDGDDSSVGSSSASSSSSEDMKLKVNKNFAKAYQNRKQLEELQRMRGRNEGIESDESSSEEEDENGNLLTSSMNLQFLKTIKALRKKEDFIYDKNKRFFYAEPRDDKVPGGELKETKKRKPKHFKDVLRQQILEQMDEKGNGSTSKEELPSKSRLAYNAQQEQIRKSFLEGAESADGERSGSDEETWMVVKNRQTISPEDDIEAREEFAEIEKISRNQSDKEKIVDPRGEIEDGDKYLLDFFKNKRWVDHDDDYANDDDSLEDLERADDYEATYNFRFEQAEAEAATSGANLSVQTYARGSTVNTVRRMDTTRKEKRQSRKERKAAERRAKEEQLKRLKNAKRQATNRKLAQIKSVLGSVDHEAVDEVAIMKMLEGDYDPEQFEKAMNEAYGDDFYQQEDQEWRTDLDVREDLRLNEDSEGAIAQDDVEGGMYNMDEGGEGEEGDVGHSGAEEENDWGEDYDAGMEGEVAEETELEKRVRTKMQEELYKLDYEDIVAGMPTRFKYRQVEANDYGLSTHEVLLARDATLKQFVSLKKMAPYNEEGEHHVGSKKRRRFRESLKQDLEDEPQRNTATAHSPDENKESKEESRGDTKKKIRRRLKKGKKRDKEIRKATSSSETTMDSSETPNGLSQGALGTKTSTSASKKELEIKIREKEVSPEEKLKNKDGVILLSDDPESAIKQNASTEKKKKRKRKRKDVLGLPSSRLASYGL